MIGYEPATTGNASVDGFPPLTDEQCARVAALLALAKPKPEAETSCQG